VQRCSGAEEQADSPRARRRRAAGRRRSRASQAVAVARRAEALLSLGRGRREQASKYLGTLSSYVREPALEINSGRVDRTGGARGNWTGRARVELFWGATNVRS
jgi:hypothetical protein